MDAIDAVQEPQPMSDPVMAIAGDTNTNTSKKKKKSKKKKSKTKNMYEAYLGDSGSDVDSVTGGADSGSDADGGPEEAERRQLLSVALPSTLYEEFVPGMDINILVQQTVQNLVQSVCLDDSEGNGRFGDFELSCFAAALKGNSSIVSLLIRNVEVSDVSLVPLCKALETHPSLRALDLAGTRGGEATSHALCRLACTNSSLIFARLDSTVATEADAATIALAVRYNALACADVGANPFHLGLLRQLGEAERRQHEFEQELQARPWAPAASSGSGGSAIRTAAQHLAALAAARREDAAAAAAAAKKGKKREVVYTPKATLGAPVCPLFLADRCPFGSRCKYSHPERTTALRNAVSSHQHSLAEREGGGAGDTASMVTAATLLGGATTATTGLFSGGKARLRSRLRPSDFTLREIPLPRPSPSGEGGAGNGDDDSSSSEGDEEEEGGGALVTPAAVAAWGTLLTLVSCCTLLTTYA